MPARTGQEFLSKLDDGREIWVDGEKVASVPAHPAFAGAARALGEVFDLQHEYPDDCLMPDPETAEPIAVSHMLPKSKDDLLRRHRGLERVAEYSVGLMGRTPDYMNVTYAGFAARADEWAANGNDEGAANLAAYQKELRRRDLSLTHTIVHTTFNLAKGTVPVGLEDRQLHKVEDTGHGILVSGSRILATLAPFADELAVYPGSPMPDAADRHAVCFNVPMNTPGLKFLCRDSTSRTWNLFDHPFSSRFDEQDAFVVFDRVEVPRSRVFIDANLAVYNAVMMTSWWPNIMQQTMIRAQTKLEFAWGIACRMAETINIANKPDTQHLLAEIWTYAELARSAIVAAEQNAREYGNGAWFPAHEPLMALRASMPVWMPRVNEIIRQLGSHNVFTAPSRAQFQDNDLRPLLDHYLAGVEVDAERRARVFRLGWDFAGTALASRNEQYERFYLGSRGRNLMQVQMRADRTRADRLVDRFLDEPLD